MGEEVAVDLPPIDPREHEPTSAMGVLRGQLVVIGAETSG